MFSCPHHRQQVFNANQESTSLRLQLADVSQHDVEAAAVAAGEAAAARALLDVKEKALMDSEFLDGAFAFVWTGFSCLGSV
jgi:hypothetical protein